MCACVHPRVCVFLCVNVNCLYLCNTYISTHSIFYIFCICMYTLRNMKIFLACDKSVPISDPDFSFDGEKDPFEYVSV